MARTIRFHLDENCHRAVAEGLRRRRIDVSTTPETGLMIASDEEQLAYGLAQGRVVFTQDRASFGFTLQAMSTRGLRTVRRIRSALERSFTGWFSSGRCSNPKKCGITSSISN
jgi:hypothetical protein